MRTPQSPRRVIDVRGLCSPQPVLFLADEAESIGPGETIAVLSDDSNSKADFFHWCESSQMDIVEMQYLAGMDRFVFRRPAVAVDPQSRQHPKVPSGWGRAAWVNGPGRFR
jgi:TusA-related sulfurtransferase